MARSFKRGMQQSIGGYEYEPRPNLPNSATDNSLYQLIHDKHARQYTLLCSQTQGREGKGTSRFYRSGRIGARVNSASGPLPWGYLLTSTGPSESEGSVVFLLPQRYGEIFIKGKHFFVDGILQSESRRNSEGNFQTFGQANVRRHFYR